MAISFKEYTQQQFLLEAKNNAREGENYKAWGIITDEGDIISGDDTPEEMFEGKWREHLSLATAHKYSFMRDRIEYVVDEDNNLGLVFRCHNTEREGGKKKLIPGEMYFALVTADRSKQLPLFDKVVNIEVILANSEYYILLKNPITGAALFPFLRKYLMDDYTP